MRKLLACIAAIVAFVVPASGVSASSSSFHDHLTGVEVLPVSSTHGTFAGVATGSLPGTWYAGIDHVALSGTETVDITGGSFTFHRFLGRSFDADVQGGSVEPTGGDCSAETFHINATLSDGYGSFTGTLTHYGFRFFRTCIVYSASIVGDWTRP